MTPDELDELSRLEADCKLAEERRPSFCTKFKYFFFKQEYPSHLATYLQLKKQHGGLDHFACIDNESILRNYGIEVPSNSSNFHNEVMQEETKVEPVAE